MPDPALMISLTINEPRWREIPLEVDLENFLESMARTAFLSANNGCLSQAEMIDLSIVLSHDDEIKQINHQYRDKNKPTNVLSFPQLTPQEIAARNLNIPGLVPLGDIIMSYETILREAKEQNKEPDAHIGHMLVHGVLHLLGYDHENDHDADEMESLETAIMTGLGFNPPYDENPEENTFNDNCKSIKNEDNHG